MTTEPRTAEYLFTAFAGFTAFGAAIVAVLASGGGVQTVADLWVRRARRKHPRDRWTWLRNPLFTGVWTLFVFLVVLGSGAGLLLSFFWLHWDWAWTHQACVGLFYGEAGGVTLATLVTVVFAWLASVAKAKDASQSGKGQPAYSTYLLVIAPSAAGQPASPTEPYGTSNFVCVAAGPASEL